MCSQDNTNLFVFKQKTAYEMRMSDWSSDVCSSDLAVEEAVDVALRVVEAAGAGPAIGAAEDRLVAVLAADAVDLGGGDVQRLVPGNGDEGLEIGSASCRERVSQYV